MLAYAVEAYATIHGDAFDLLTIYLFTGREMVYADPHFCLTILLPKKCPKLSYT